MRLAAAIMWFMVFMPAITWPQDAPDDQKILSLMEEIARAYVEREAAPFERIYDEHYISIRSKPIYNSRDQLIAMMKADAVILKAGRKLDYETLSYNADHPQIRLFGSTAIVNSRKNNNWQYRGSMCLTRYQVTDVWVKNGDKWELAASQSTTFQCDPMPWIPGHAALTAVPSEYAPKSHPDSAVENEIKAALNLENEAAADKLFAKGYIHTNLEGQVLPERGQLIAALQAGKEREGQVIQVFDHTAVYLFRQNVPARPGKRSFTQQFMVVLVKHDERWQIAASHVTKYTE